MYTVDQQLTDESKVGVFFISFRLIKGYRYKYRYIWRDSETIDYSEDVQNAVDKEGIANNILEVGSGGTIADFIT